MQLGVVSGQLLAYSRQVFSSLRAQQTQLCKRPLVVPLSVQRLLNMALQVRQANCYWTQTPYTQP